MLVKVACKAMAASLTAIHRTVQFIERRSETADLLASDLARHLSRAETQAEKRCLWLKAAQNSSKAGLCCPCFCWLYLWELSICRRDLQAASRMRQNQAEEQPAPAAPGQEAGEPDWLHVVQPEQAVE